MPYQHSFIVKVFLVISHKPRGSILTAGTQYIGVGIRPYAPIQAGLKEQTVLAGAERASAPKALMEGDVAVHQRVPPHRDAVGAVTHCVPRPQTVPRFGADLKYRAVLDHLHTKHDQVSLRMRRKGIQHLLRHILPIHYVVIRHQQDIPVGGGQRNVAVESHAAGRGGDHFHPPIGGVRIQDTVALGLVGDNRVASDIHFFGYGGILLPHSGNQNL